MRNVNLLWVFVILLISCIKEPDSLNVSINQSGTVSVKVVDANKNIFKGAQVSIYSSTPADQRIYFDSTDVSGECKIGKILQGQYKCYVSATNDKKTYTYSEYFQIIAGDDKTVEINPFQNIGTISIKILDYQSAPVANVNVALIPHPNYSNEDYPFNTLIKEAHFVSKTDAEGWVRIEGVPVDKEYSVLAYFDSNKYSYPKVNNYAYSNRFEERRFTIDTNF
jgi:hypothetical protein